MSFGFSVGDIIGLAALTSRVYNNWKNACGEYAAITSELRSLSIILRRLETEAQSKGSPLSTGRNDYKELATMVENCKVVVVEINSILTKFKSLGQSRSRNWHRIKLAHTNHRTLRNTLATNTQILSTYLNTVGILTLGRLEKRTEKVPEIAEAVKRVEKGLQEMTRAIDERASEMRAGRREASILSTYSNDDKDVWKQFRGELIRAGFKSASVHKYRHQLKSYLKMLHENGRLDEEEPAPVNPGHDRIAANVVEAPCQIPDSDGDTPKGHSIPIKNVQSNYEKATFEDVTDVDEGPFEGDLQRQEELSPVDMKQEVASEAERPVQKTFEEGRSVNFSQTDGSQGSDLDRSESSRCPFSKVSLSNSDSETDRYYPDTYEGTSYSSRPSRQAGLHSTGRRSAYPYAGQPSSDSEAKNPPPGENTSSSGDGAYPGDPFYQHNSPTFAPPHTRLRPAVRPVSELRRCITYKKLPLSELYPMKSLPCLPEGWDFRINHRNRLFYIDGYALVGEKKCFWEPPIQELFPNEPTATGWTRIETLFGRVYWRDDEFGLVSYEHPKKSRAITWKDDTTWEVRYRSQGNKDYAFEPWNEQPTARPFRLCDEGIACQMTVKVWKDGLSALAIEQRGQLWWREYDTCGTFDVAEHTSVSNPMHWRGDAIKVWEMYCRRKQQGEKRIPRTL